MSGHLQPIKLDSYKPLRELVCENIRQAIIDGTFSPGERLMEIQLADEMGVSRTPVREALIFWPLAWLPSVLQMRSLNSLTVILLKSASISPTMIWIKSSK